MPAPQKKIRKSSLHLCFSAKFQWSESKKGWNHMQTLKKLAVSLVAATTLAAVGAISASAAIGSISCDNGYATLTNNTSTNRYGIVKIQAINRKTGAYSTEKGLAEGKLSGYSTATATLTGFSPLYYTFYAHGTLYNSTNPNSGVAWTGSDTY